MPKKYVITRDVDRAKEGTIVYQFIRYDYGSSREDTQVFKEAYTSVCFNPEGDYPYITVPTNSLKEV